VGVPAVDEPFAPVAGGQLALGNGEAFEVEHPGEVQPAQSPGLEMDDRLDYSDLAERAPARNRVRPLERRHRVRSDVRPGPALGRQGGRRHQAQGQRGEPPQSDSATAAWTGASAARSTSRFIRVIASMLISLGHASWHSP